MKLTVEQQAQAYKAYQDQVRFNAAAYDASRLDYVYSRLDEWATMGFMTLDDVKVAYVEDRITMRQFEKRVERILRISEGRA